MTESFSLNPAAADMYCGLGGWAEGFLSEGFDVIGFDTERHDYGTGGYPGKLVIQNVLTIHGSQLVRGAMRDRLRVIVASPPCQKYSYMAMPWRKAKALAAWYRESPERIAQLNALFNACFRIQLEAIEAAGRFVPLIVENVKGAQPWVGPAKWHFGSYYLWGDIPALMPIPQSRATKLPEGNCVPRRWDERDIQRLCDGTKNSGQDWSRFAKTGEVSPHWRMAGLKGPETEWRENGCRGDNNRMTPEIKNNGGSWFGNYQEMKAANRGAANRRKMASAMIAKIPFPLARHIARCFK